MTSTTTSKTGRQDPEVVSPAAWVANGGAVNGSLGLVVAHGRKSTDRLPLGVQPESVQVARSH